MAQQDRCHHEQLWGPCMDVKEGGNEEEVEDDDNDEVSLANE